MVVVAGIGVVCERTAQVCVACYGHERYIYEAPTLAVPNDTSDVTYAVCVI